MGFPIAAAIAGANQGVTDTMDLMDRQRIAQMRDLQLQEMQQGAMDRSTYRALVPKILAAPPETATVGARPASLSWPSDEEGSGAAVASARPGTTVSAPTMGSIARAVGPEGLGVVAAHPEGRAFLKEQGVLTNEQFEQRRRRAEALEEFKAASETVQSKYEAGDTLGALLAERNGYRALASAVDDPTPLLGKVNDLTKEYTRIAEKQKHDEQYKKDLQTDGQAYVKALNEYKDAVAEDAKVRATGQPSDQAALKRQALMSTALQFKTDWGQKKRDVLFAKIEEGVANDIQNEPLARLDASTAASINQQIEKGQKPDYKSARRDAFRANPDAVGALIGAARTHKTPLSDADLSALGIEGTPKNEYEEADRIVTESLNIPRSDPRYIAQFTQELTKLHTARQKPAKDTESRDSIRQALQFHRDAITRVGQLRREYATASRNGLADPGDLEDLKRQIADAERQRMSAAKDYRDLTGRDPDDGQAPPTVTKPDPSVIKTTTEQVIARKYKGKKKRLEDLNPTEQASVLADVNRQLGLTGK